MRKSLLLLLLSIIPTLALNLPVHEKVLPNGLKILIVPRPDVAVVSCRLYYYMGSYYEAPGTSGLSHMYEHMMFKGTKRLGTTNYQAELPLMAAIDSIDAEIGELKRAGHLEEDSLIQEKRDSIFAILDKQREYITKDEIWGLYQKAGGTGLNAWTSDDMTAYIVTLPANKLELFANIEADRMENLVLREFYSERDVVTEERRMRYENKPTNNYWLRLESMFYAASPYRIPTIGWYSDIRNYTRDKMTQHIQKFYRPDNALLILTGNVDTTTAFPLLERYFADIARPETPLERVVTKEPAPIGEQRLSVTAEAKPRLDIMYHTPGFPHADLYKLDMLENILSGRSGRLHKRLVDEERLCTAVGAGNRWRIADGNFHIWASLTADADPSKVEAIILEEIEKLSHEDPSAEELERTRNQIAVYFARQLTKLESLSDNLAFFAKLGRWQELYDYETKISAVTSTKEAVTLWLKPEHRTVGTLISKEKKHD